MATFLRPIPVITRLSSHIVRVLGCNPGPMTLQGTNTYLLGTGKRRMLIDTGDPDVPEYIDNLKKVLDSEKAVISTIILTHWHHDHVGGVKDILKFTNEKECTVWKFARTDAPDVCPEIPENITVQKLKNGQTFTVEGAAVEIVHTPGHTTDHVVLKMNDGTLFSGDCILGEGTAVFEDLYEYMQSLNRILTLKPSTIYPAHGNVIDEPIPKIEYYIKHRTDRERQILEVFKQNPGKVFNEFDIVKIVYKETPEALWSAAAFNVNHHLKKLTKELILNEMQENNAVGWILANKSSL